MAYVEWLAEAAAAGRPAAVAKLLTDPLLGQALVVSPAGVIYSDVPDPALEASVAAVAMQFLAEGRSGVATVRGDVRVYIESHRPDPVLLVIGAGHVGQMVAQLGAMAGFDVAVLDDRPQYANPERFPMASRVLCGPFAAELAGLDLGPQHYVVLMTRGHHHDRLCLEELIGADLAYLGMIGSRTRVETIFAALEAEGVDRERLQRVRAPIGLDIGARTPAEIAVSVVAELIAVRRSGTGAPLSSLGRALVHTQRRS